MLEYLNEPLKIRSDRPTTPQYADYLQKRYNLRAVPNLPKLSPPQTKDRPEKTKRSIARQRREARQEVALNKFQHKGEAMAKQRKSERRKLDKLTWESNLSQSQRAAVFLSPKGANGNSPRRRASLLRSPRKNRPQAKPLISPPRRASLRLSPNKNGSQTSLASLSQKKVSNAPPDSGTKKTTRQLRLEREAEEEAQLQAEVQKQKKRKEAMAERAYQRRMQQEEQFAERMKKLAESKSVPSVSPKKKRKGGPNSKVGQTVSNTTRKRGRQPIIEPKQAGPPKHVRIKRPMLTHMRDKCPKEFGTVVEQKWRKR
jgi:hypothetical protein